MANDEPVIHFPSDLPLPTIRPLWQHLVGDCGEVIEQEGDEELAR